MSELTWGQIAKSVDDKQTIEDYVNGLFTAHNTDVSAHGQLGEGISNHRVGEVLDHLNGSVSWIKMTGKQRFYYTPFNSIDGWDFDKNAVPSFGGLVLTTDPDPNHDSWLGVEPKPYSDLVDKNPIFQTSIRFSTITDKKAFWGMGAADLDGSPDAGLGFGFLVTGGKLYAHNSDTNTDDHNRRTEITGVTLTDVNVFRIEFDTDESEIRFYVNGVLKATHGTYLPPDTDNLLAWYKWLSTSGDEEEMTVNFLIVAFDY